MSIYLIDELYNSLREKEKERFSRIFRFDIYTASLVLPQTMKEWIKKRFGSVSSVKNQKIVKINNIVSGEGTLFNELRSKRPIEREDVKIEKKDCSFCNALENTPEDEFGRIHGKNCITASNIAKYDVYHSLVIFNDCLLYTSPSPRDLSTSRMPSSA